MKFERDFYSVADVANRWGVSAEEVLHQADCGKLVLSVSLLGLDIQIRRSRKDGYSGNILPEISMIFDLPVWAARRIARVGEVDVDELSCHSGMVEVEVVAGLLHLTTYDVLVTSKEIARIEKLGDESTTAVALPGVTDADDDEQVDAWIISARNFADDIWLRKLNVCQKPTKEGIAPEIAGRLNDARMVTKRGKKVSADYVVRFALGKGWHPPMPD